MKAPPNYEVTTLGGVRYAILPEAALLRVLRVAKIAPRLQTEEELMWPSAVGSDTLGERIRARRRRAALTQAELARRSGVRVETLNRLERGRTTPDFSTIRKLVKAMNAVEAGLP